MKHYVLSLAEHGPENIGCETKYTVRSFYLCYSRVRPHPADFGSRISERVKIHLAGIVEGIQPF
jgi:hypothetical protein